MSLPLFSLCSINDKRNSNKSISNHKQTNKQAKVWAPNSFCFRVTVYLSVWHSTFETHNHKTKIYSQGSGSTSVSLVSVQQLPTGQSRKKHHESCSADMFELESLLKKEQASLCTSIAAGCVQNWSHASWCLNKKILTGADIHPRHKSCKVLATWRWGGERRTRIVF